jgi:hypothetical protein
MARVAISISFRSGTIRLQAFALPDRGTDGLVSRCVFAWHIGAARAVAGVSDRIQLTTRRSGDLFRRIGASTGACSRTATCPMNVRGYAMRSLRRGLAYLRQAMPGTVRYSANAPPAATVNRLQGIVWSGCRAMWHGGICPVPAPASNFVLSSFSTTHPRLSGTTRPSDMFRWRHTFADRSRFAAVEYSRVLKKRVFVAGVSAFSGLVNQGAGIILHRV